jgi:hypothetical protein
MSGANAAVHAWNFTTGRTKSDLSTLLIGAGALTLMVNTVTNPEYHCSPLIKFPLYSIMVGINTIVTPQVESDELNALRNQMKNIEVENYKRNQKLGSFVFASLTICSSLLSITYSDFKHKNSEIVEAIGTGLIAAGLYIISADPLPPRKSLLERGYDKLKEIISSYQRKPVYETVRA